MSPSYTERYVLWYRSRLVAAHAAYYRTRPRAEWSYLVPPGPPPGEEVLRLEAAAADMQADGVPTLHVATLPEHDPRPVVLEPGWAH